MSFGRQGIMKMGAAGASERYLLFYMTLHPRT